MIYLDLDVWQLYLSLLIGKKVNKLT